MANPTPTTDSKLARRHSDFSTLLEACYYAKDASTGSNFYTGRGELIESVTHAENVERGMEIGRRMINLGIGSQDRVALIAETNADFTAHFTGCQFAGALPVPMPMPVIFGGKDAYLDLIRRQVMTSGSRMLVASEDMIGLARQATAGLDLIFIGTPAEFAGLPVGEADPIKEVHPDQLAYLQYSSGSTRFPHGVAVTHRALMFNCNQMAFHGWNIADGDRLSTWLPFYHDMGLVGFFLVSLACQVTSDYLSPDDFARRPMQWLSLISKNGGTLTYSPSFGYELTARRASESVIQSLDLRHFRGAGIGGDMIKADVLANFAETFAPAGFSAKAFVPSYGLAEHTLAVSFSDYGTGVQIDYVDEDSTTNDHYAAPIINGEVKHGVRVRGYVNCGKPLRGTTVEIRDADDNVLEDRQVGRVVLDSEALMEGYFGDDEATAECMSDGWLDTGDMGYMLDGSLYIVGRFKDMMIVHGRNIWPQDIEWAVERLPNIRSGDVAAFSVTDSNGNDDAKILIQCRSRDEEARRSLASEVSSIVQKTVGIGADVLLVPHRSLPKTSSGKLSRSKSKALFLEGMFESAVAEAASL